MKGFLHWVQIYGECRNKEGKKVPYENDKNKEVRSGGKKSVTKKSSASSGSGRSSASQTSKPKTGSSNRSTSSRPAGSGAKKPASSQNRTGAKKTAQSTKPKTSETARSRQNTSAKEDYKLFSQDVKRKAQSEKASNAKKTVQDTKRKSTGSAARGKGKSQSRSKLTTALTYIMIVFAFIALMVTLSLTVFFKIETIKVTADGAKYYTEEKVTALSGIEKGQNIFSVDTETIEKNIENTMPYIENCEIKREFPAGINIKITGAEPAGVITLDTGERLVVSSEGKSLERLEPYIEIKISDSDAVSATDTEETSETDISGTDIPVDFGRNDHSVFIDETKLPEIIGLVISDGTQPGSYIVLEDETAIATLKNLVSLLEKYDLPPTKIDLSAGSLYTYYDSRLMIKLGSGADLEMKIALASDIIHNKLSEYDSGRVDVTNPQKGYFTPEYLLKEPK